MYVLYKICALVVMSKSIMHSSMNGTDGSFLSQSTAWYYNYINIILSIETHLRNNNSSSLYLRNVVLVESAEAALNQSAFQQSGRGNFDLSRAPHLI